MNRRLRTPLVLAAVLAACAAAPELADPASDAPEARVAPAVPPKPVASYAEALGSWRSAADINAWIGANFEYDPPRALRLSETQRSGSGRLAIHAPGEFFAEPRGVCVDLARFAVETLRAIDPAAGAAYLMIEFDPVSVQGNTLRLHWVATYRSGGLHYVFADSKRPGHLAGPYASLAQFAEEYARYRGRRIVSYLERDSYGKTLRTPAARKPAAARDEGGRAPGVQARPRPLP